MFKIKRLYFDFLIILMPVFYLFGMVLFNAVYLNKVAGKSIVFLTLYGILFSGFIFLYNHPNRTSIAKYTAIISIIIYISFEPLLVYFPSMRFRFASPPSKETLILESLLVFIVAINTTMMIFRISFIKEDNISQNNPEMTDVSPLNIENEKLKARIAELENQKQVETQTIAEPKQIRIQRHHKALFALLVKKNYNDFNTRNSLFNAINADLKLNGITSDEAKFATYNKLIDDDLFKQLEIFPNKKR